MKTVAIDTTKIKAIAETMFDDPIKNVYVLVDLDKVVVHVYLEDFNYTTAYKVMQKVESNEAYVIADGFGIEHQFEYVCDNDIVFTHIVIALQKLADFVNNLCVPPAIWIEA